MFAPALKLLLFAELAGTASLGGLGAVLLYLQAALHLVERHRLSTPFTPSASLHIPVSPTGQHAFQAVVARNCRGQGRHHVIGKTGSGLPFPTCSLMSSASWLPGMPLAL